MGKPRHAVYEKFCRKYAALNEKLGKKQYLVPYLMSSHPGCGLREAVFGPDGIQERLDHRRISIRQRRQMAGSKAAVGWGGHAGRVPSTRPAGSLSRCSCMLSG